MMLGVLLVAAVGAAFALNSGGGSSVSLLPPPPHGQRAAEAGPQRPHAAGNQPRAVGNGEDVTRIVHPALSHRGPLAAGGPPGAASLAGRPPAVLSRFATLWANRSASPNLRDQGQLVGLSGGAWAKQVLRSLPLSLPSIPGVRARGSLVVFKVRTSGPGTKTAVVVTQERLLVPGSGLGAPRYAVYVARLDWLKADGYVITSWVQQI